MLINVIQFKGETIYLPQRSSEYLTAFQVGIGKSIDRLSIRSVAFIFCLLFLLLPEIELLFGFAGFGTPTITSRVLRWRHRTCQMTGVVLTSPEDWVTYRNPRGWRPENMGSVGRLRRRIYLYNKTTWHRVWTNRFRLAVIHRVIKVNSGVWQRQQVSSDLSNTGQLKKKRWWCVTVTVDVNNRERLQPGWTYGPANKVGTF